MKYATKLMVVPFVNRLEDPTEKYLNNLDEELSEILKRRDLAPDQKLKMYNTILGKFLIKKTDSKIQVRNYPNDVQIDVKHEPLDVKNEQAEAKNEPHEINETKTKSNKKIDKQPKLEKTSKKEKKRLKAAQKLDENLANLNSNNSNINNTAADSNIPHTRNYIQNQNLNLIEPYANNLSPARAATKKKRLNNAKIGLGLVSKHNFHWITTKYF
jgi:hypothetical protein